MAQLEVGRVAFQSDDCWRVQTLRNHVGNVVKLVEAWDDSADFADPNFRRAKREWVIRAAKIHDMGKPKRFQIIRKKNGDWSYSFSGHRFDAFDAADDGATPYVDWLAKLHHEFSVDGITRAMADLRLRYPAPQAVAESLPLDLYLLEMCDQIEATVGSSVMEGKQPEGRVFMEFEFKMLDEQTFCVDPFVFHGDSLALTIEWAEVAPDIMLIEKVKRMELKEDYKVWELRQDVNEKLRKAALHTREVTLCRWR